MDGHLRYSRLVFCCCIQDQGMDGWMDSRRSGFLLLYTRPGDGRTDSRRSGALLLHTRPEDGRTEDNLDQTKY